MMTSYLTRVIGDWMSAVIALARQEGTYDVTFADGEEDKRLLYESIRRIVSDKPSNSDIDVSDGHVSKDDISENGNKPTSVKHILDVKKKFSEGDKILANYRGRGQWFGGVVAKVHQDCSYDILYDDSEEEFSVIESKIRLFHRDVDVDVDDFIEGKAVEGNYQDSGKWVRGHIKLSRDDGTYDVVYEDGYTDVRILREMIRSIDIDEDIEPEQPEVQDIVQNRDSPSKSLTYSEGMKVEGNYRGCGKWYPGVIKKVLEYSDTNVYKILYDDGEEEDSVKASCIRLPEAAQGDITPAESGWFN
jgi:Agenet domain